MKLVIATPTITRPHEAYLAALGASVPALDAAGIEHYAVNEIGSAYISWARANMLWKAMKHGADVIVFIDHDVAWRPSDLLKLLAVNDDVVAGTYRFKKDIEEYMGTIKVHPDTRPVVRHDGCIEADWIPAGFLKVTRSAVERFMARYPALCFGPDRDRVDLFNHGVYDGVWYGEDYAFSRNWHDIGGDIWLVPDINLDHHSGSVCYRGNFHQFMLRRPGGSLDPARIEQQSAA